LGLNCSPSPSLHLHALLVLHLIFLFIIIIIHLNITVWHVESGLCKWSGDTLRLLRFAVIICCTTQGYTIFSLSWIILRRPVHPYIPPLLPAGSLSTPALLLCRHMGPAAYATAFFAPSPDAIEKRNTKLSVSRLQQNHYSLILRASVAYWSFQNNLPLPVFKSFVSVFFIGFTKKCFIQGNKVMFVCMVALSGRTSLIDNMGRKIQIWCAKAFIHDLRYEQWWRLPCWVFLHCQSLIEKEALEHTTKTKSNCQLRHRITSWETGLFSGERSSRLYIIQ